MIPSRAVASPLPPRIITNLPGRRSRSIVCVSIRFPWMWKPATTAGAGAVVVPREARIALAESLYADGQYSPAAVQLKKAFALEGPSGSEYLFFAECCVQLGLMAEGREAVEHALKLDPDSPAGNIEKANLLYLQNSFLELRDFLRPRMERFSTEAAAWNLLGHGEFGLGNWSEAAAAYDRAAALDTQMPIFAMNAAHAWERANEGEEALARYLAAARLYFRQESYFDMEGLLPVIRGALLR